MAFIVDGQKSVEKIRKSWIWKCPGGAMISQKANTQRQMPGKGSALLRHIMPSLNAGVACMEIDFWIHRQKKGMYQNNWKNGDIKNYEKPCKNINI